MAKTFDATLNSLIDARLGDWAAYLTTRCGLPAGPASALDTDLSATLQADRLFHVDGRPPFALHLELEATPQLGVPDRLLRYSVAARAATGLPVHSVLLLLRPRAAASDQTGSLSVTGADRREYLSFRYAVLRVWEERVSDLLAAGPGLAPLALLTDEAAADLAGAFTRLRERLRQPDVPATLAREVGGWAGVLAALRYDAQRIRELYMSIENILEESSLVQEWIQRGEARGVVLGEARGALEAARAIILRQAGKRFGPAPEAAEAAIRAEADQGRLDRLADRVLDATGWDDLLATP